MNDVKPFILHFYIMLDTKIYVSGGCILYIRNCCNAILVDGLTNVPY